VQGHPSPWSGAGDLRELETQAAPGVKAVISRQ
jgi:hypothetical protein